MPTRQLAPALVVTLVLALSAFASVAFAGPGTMAWSGETPAPSASLHEKAGVVGVNVVASNPLASGSGQLTVDGIAYKTVETNPASTNGYWKQTEYWDDDAECWFETWVWVMSPDLTKVTLTTYAYGGPLGKDGTHTVLATIKDTTGATSSDTWSFGVHIKPTLGAPTPAEGSTVQTLAPQISIPVADNDHVARWDVAVNGVAASASLDAGVLKVTPASPLDDDASATVAVTIFDGDGNSASVSWKFEVQTLAEMLDTASECSDCHPGYENDPDMTGDCSQCHSGANLPHPSRMHRRADVRGCSGCHVSSITVEHARRLDSGGAQITCVTCHASGKPAVVAAISKWDGTCSACHGTGSHYDSIDHTATPAPQVITIAGTSFGTHACSECHSLRLGEVHQKDGAPDCANCHPSPRGSFATWQFGCVQGDCHAGSSSKPMHAGIDSAHSFPASRSDCLACHDGASARLFAGKTLAELHSSASTSTPSGTRTSCEICHGDGATPASNCLTAGCHPDRASAHGYDSAKHLSSETCLGACHNPELKPAHTAQVTAKTVACADCHATLVASIKPWSKTCAACHSTIEHSSASHAGSDAAVRVSRTNYGGCSDTPPGQVGCHDISNVSKLHFDLKDHGCPLCHGSGKTPSNDCRTCHPQNDPPATESKVATFFPTADVSAVGSITISSGASLYQAVDEYPADDDATYFQFTSPGTVLLRGAGSIPASATITNVRVNYRARTGSSTTRSLYPTVMIGGQKFTGSASNPAGTYISPPYQMSTNPKTGAAWTPDELNSTGGASTLDSYGLATTNASNSATGYLRVTQVYVTVNYTLPLTVPAGTLLGGTWYHHNNVKYLVDPSDAATGTFYYPDGSPPHGWYDALYYQDCSDSCHAGIWGDPSWSAQQGTYMWYSVGGDPWDSPLTRTLTLKAVTIPADSPTLSFQTDYDMLDGAEGLVEISTDGGGSWTALAGTVGGVSTPSYSGTAPGWQLATYDLSAYAGRSAKLRFRYENGYSSTSAGWAFDSLSISGSSGPVFTDDAETLKPDWDNSYWTRSRGAYPYM